MTNINQQQLKVPNTHKRIRDPESNKNNISFFDQNALLIFGTLLILYLITFNGQFTSIDELNLYSMAESLVQTGTTTVPQVSFASYHNPVGNHEVGFPLAATPLYWLANRSNVMNNIYFVMLLNPILVAATSVFIFLSARKLGYSATGSTLAAFAYGLASLGWPYALTFYREPLVGFLWTAGIYGLISWCHSGNKWMGSIGTLCILLSPLVKVNILFSIPFLFLVALKGKPTWKKRHYIVLAVSFVAMFIAFQLLYFLRVGNAWNYLQTFTNINLIQLLLRVYGQLFSPIKGLIFYMPVIVLVIPGLYYMQRNHRFVAISIALSFLSLVAVLSFYGAWYGGQSWGPRLLVPVIPIVMIPIASLWDAVQKRSNHIVIILLLLLSIVMQLPVVTSNWWSGYSSFYSLSSTPENTVGLSFRYLALSPPWVLLRKWEPADLNWLWLQRDKSDVWHTNIGLGGFLIACLASLFIIWKFRITKRIGFLLLLPVLAATIVLQVAGGHISIGYPGMTSETGEHIAEAARFVEPDPYTLVTMSNEFHIYFFEGFFKGDFVHHWVSPNQIDGFEFERILENTKGRWLSLIIDRVHIEPGFTGKELEWWMNKHLYRIGVQWFEGYELIRYAIISSENWDWQPIQSEFGPFQFDEFAINTTQLSPHDVLGIQLQVCSLAETLAEYQIFLHLLGEDGTVEGLDGPIGYGAIDTAQWQTGDCFIEKRGIYIPPDAQVGSYDLIIGVYTPEGAILPTFGTDGSVTYQTLTRVDILDE